MILDKYLTVYIKNTSAQSYYMRITDNTTDIPLNDFAHIPFEYISHNSHEKINCKCKICDKTSNISYSKYNKNIKEYNYYTCKKCSIVKRKQTTEFRCLKVFY